MTTLNKSPTDSVVSPGVVVGGILLAAYQLLGVEQLSVGPGSNLVDHCRLQIDENSPKHKKKNSVRSLPGHQCYREATFLGGSGSPEFREPTPVLTKLGRLQLQAKKKRHHQAPPAPYTKISHFSPFLDHNNLYKLLSPLSHI